MEKERFIQQDRAASPVSSHGHHTRAVPQDPKWQPGFAARFPWVGFLSIMTVLVCAAASVAVLVTSNGQSVTHWPTAIAPNVLINIMSSVENICFLIAIGSASSTQCDNEG
jgi:hypothetical protein